MRQILTHPPECLFPTQDNVDGNLVVSKGDTISKSKDVRYIVVELLGTGTFGQVFRCVSNYGDEVAIKIIKASNKYYQYSMNEVRALKRLKDANLTRHFVILHDAFIYQQHLCIVLELLGINMYEFTKKMHFVGMEYPVLRTVLRQILEALCELHREGVTHSDLKPENILVSDIFHHRVKIIDFGSSTTRAMSTLFYAQSRFYRAPEVILGIPYSCLVDIWSFGCVAYELLMGHPLFPGTDNHDQIHLISEFFEEGLPSFMLEHGEKAQEFLGRESSRAMNGGRRFTYATMISQIYERHKSAPENELFIEMLTMALKPSYLERALPHTLLSHPFFLEPTGGESAMLEVPRKVSPPIPPTPEMLRKNSMFNYGQEDINSKRKGPRKGSMYNLEYENRFNS